MVLVSYSWAIFARKQWFKLLHTMTLGDPTQIKNIQNLPIVHHYGYVCDLPPGHRFPMKKFHKVYAFLCSSGIITQHTQVVMPYKIEKSVASLVHTTEYVDKFFSGSTSTEEQRVTGFSWTSQLVDRVRYESGMRRHLLIFSCGNHGVYLRHGGNEML